MIKIFTSHQVENIYFNKVKKDDSYFKKYESLEPFKDSFIESLFSNKDFPRIPCVLDFKNWVNKYKINPQKMLITCPNDYELNYINFSKYHIFEYDPNDNTGDLHKITNLDKDFDFFLFSQTLEHLYNPLLCVKNIFDHIAPGGYVFTSVPTINIPHMTPFHFSGIYPMGLSLLFESVGFEVKEIGQWGNLDYITELFNNHNWADYNFLLQKGGGTIKNEEKNVAQCWCLAQKPF